MFVKAILVLGVATVIAGGLGLGLAVWAFGSALLVGVTGWELVR